MHILQMPLSKTHHAELSTAVNIPKFIILVGWAQSSVAQIVLFSGLDHVWKI